MNMILLLAMLFGCTRKYADYDLIRKVDFNKETFERPVTLTQIMPSGKDEAKHCFNQWLFFSNAEKEKNSSVPFIVRSLCPRNEYLVNAHMTEDWWTSIIFTQSCVNIKTQCADSRRKE